MIPEPPISVLDFLLTDAADVPFEIGRLETTHRLRTSRRPHRHSYYQIIWVLDGAGVHATDFEEHAIRPPLVFLISPGQVHAVRVDRPLSGYMLLFTVVAVHACGVLTDRVLDAALAARAAVAVLPCCHNLRLGDTAGLEAWIDGALAVDTIRALRLRAAGYCVSLLKIPVEITSQNRLLIGAPEVPAAPLRAAGSVRMGSDRSLLYRGYAERHTLPFVRLRTQDSGLRTWFYGRGSGQCVVACLAGRSGVRGRRDCRPDGGPLQTGTG